MIGNQTNANDGTVTLSVKVPTWLARQLNIIARQRGDDINANHLLALCLQFIAETAKASGPLSVEMKTLLNMLKLDASWNNAFNFSSVSAQMDIAQVILILQQHEGEGEKGRARQGFGLAMIDKPFMGGESRMTLCVDDILERVAEVSMKGLYRQLRQIGNELGTESLRETLTTLCDAQTIVNLEADFQSEMPQMGDRADNGRSYAYGQRTRQTKRRTPDTLQQRITFGDDDRQQADDEVERSRHDEPSGQPDSDPEWRPFGSEW